MNLNSVINNFIVNNLSTYIINNNSLNTKPQTITLTLILSKSLIINNNYIVIPHGFKKVIVTILLNNLYTNIRLINYPGVIIYNIKTITLNNYHTINKLSDHLIIDLITNNLLIKKFGSSTVKRYKNTTIIITNNNQLLSLINRLTSGRLITINKNNVTITLSIGITTMPITYISTNILHTYRKLTNYINNNNNNNNIKKLYIKTTHGSLYTIYNY